MNASARRVALALVLVSFFTLSYSTFTSGLPVCSGFSGCGAALSLYTLDLSGPTSQSTAPHVLAQGDDYTFLNQVTQIVSLYALVAGLCLLLSLEMSKPHYLKLKKSKRRRTA